MATTNYKVDVSVTVNVTNTENGNSTNATINASGTLPVDPAQVQLLILGRVNAAAEAVIAPVA